MLKCSSTVYVGARRVQNQGTRGCNATVWLPTNSILYTKIQVKPRSEKLRKLGNKQ